MRGDNESEIRIKGRNFYLPWASVLWKYLNNLVEIIAELWPSWRVRKVGKSTIVNSSCETCQTLTFTYCTPIHSITWIWYYIKPYRKVYMKKRTKDCILPVTQCLSGQAVAQAFWWEVSFWEFFQMIWKMHEDSSSLGRGIIIAGITVTKKSHCVPRKTTQYIQ